MWSAHQRKEVRLGSMLQQSSIQHNYQEQSQRRQLPSSLSPRWSHKLSQLTRILTNPQFQMGLAVNIWSCHPAPMIQCVGYYGRDSNRERVWPQLPDASIPSPISVPPTNLSNIEGWETTLTTTDDNTFFLGMSQNGFNGINCTFRFKPVLHTATSTTTNEEAEHRDVFSSKRGRVAAHLRGMRLAPTFQKDTLMLRRNSSTNIINQTQDYVLLDYFQVLYMYTDMYLIGIFDIVHIYIYIYWSVLIRNQTDPDWHGTITEQPSIHRALLN